jgi:predicted Zn-dependent peptidase
LEKEVLNPEEVLEKVDAVTKEQVEAMGQKYFVNQGLNLALIGNFEDRQALEELVQL